MKAVHIVPADASAHRHTSHEHEHEFEAQLGLPEALPAGERVLWQGAPDWRVLARECFHVRKLVLYFSVLIALRIGTVAMSGGSARELLIATAMAFALAATALGLTSLMAWLSARTSLYTITNRRVVMRVGIVLSVTFNLPFRQIDAAGLHPLAHGDGDIALTLDAKTRIAYLHLWPHVRPWHVARTQPCLRSVADAAQVAQVLTAAWREERQDVAATIAEAPVARGTSPRPTTSVRPPLRAARPDRSIDAAQTA